MALVKSILNLNSATGEPIQLDDTRAAASRCFALLVAAAATMAQLEHNANTNNVQASVAAIGELIVTLHQQGGAAGIQRDTIVLAKMAGCDLHIHIEGQEGQVH